MDGPADTDLCRVTVVGPSRRVDLVLPGYVPFADLFPAVAGYAGLGGPEVTAEPGGWVLQRLDQKPFEPAMTPFDVGLRNGETIFLRPFRVQLPPAAFDDVADAVAAGVTGRAGRWDRRATRLAGLAGGIVALAAGMAVIARAGPPWHLPLVVAAVAAVLSLLAATAVSRAHGDVGAGIPLGYVAVGYAFLAGGLVPAGTVPVAHMGAVQLLSGLATAALAAVLAGVATGEAPAYLGLVVAAVIGVVGCWVDIAFGQLGAPGAAAVTVVPTLMLTPLIPAVAFRLGRLPLPAVPRTTDDLRGAPDVDTAAVTAAAATADRFVTSAAAGIGLVAAGAEAVLALARPLLALVTCAALGATLLLRARIFRGLAQRLWLLVPGWGGLVLAAAEATRYLASLPAPAITVAVLAVGAALVTGAGLWLPGHQPSPVWGRAADIAETMLIVSLVPLALAVAGVFGSIRGLAG